jgi:hypothetical protein
MKPMVQCALLLFVVAMFMAGCERPEEIPTPGPGTEAPTNAPSAGGTE